MGKNLGATTGFFGRVLEDGNAGVTGEERRVRKERIGGACAGGVGDDKEVGRRVVVQQGIEFVLEGP